MLGSRTALVKQQRHQEQQRQEDRANCLEKAATPRRPLPGHVLWPLSSADSTCLKPGSEGSLGAEAYPGWFSVETTKQEESGSKSESKRSRTFCDVRYPREGEYRTEFSVAEDIQDGLKVGEMGMTEAKRT